MTKQEQEYVRWHNITKITGMKNLSDYPGKDETIEKLQESIKEINIEQTTQEFFKKEDDGTGNIMGGDNSQS